MSQYPPIPQPNIWSMLQIFWSVFVLLWPLYVVAGIFLVVAVLLNRLGYEINGWIVSKKFRQGDRWRNEREMIGWLRQMRPADFEAYVADVFSRLGYTMKVVGGPGDGGIDVVAEKRGIKYYIQCKRYSARNEVGVAAVRDFYGALADRVANGKGYIVTTGKFTLDAERFAEDKPIELVDSHRLLAYVRMANGETGAPAIASVSVLRCPRCGGDLLERIGTSGGRSCSNYPNCRYVAR